jgi:hypothetical protein
MTGGARGFSWGINIPHGVQDTSFSKFIKKAPAGFLLQGLLVVSKI